MTNEDAIKELKLMRYNDANTGDMDRALAMAIEALSAQPKSRCNTCRYINLEWYEEPCDSCTMGGESNHYKPSAQRTGEWIQKANIYGVAYCSECDYELHTNDTNFCPNCGADMRGEDNV